MAEDQSPGAGTSAGAESDPIATANKAHEDLRKRVESGELSVVTRDQVKQADDLVDDYVDVPEWGGVVQIRSFTKGKQIEIDKRATVNEEVDPQLVQMYAFLEGVVDPEFELDDQEWLREKSAAAFDRVVTRIFELSAIGRERAEEAEARFREGA